ncbi:hypothetical protein PVAP13_8NG185902 [Panicum virgatum]|uniref:Uncharacterized protein n=1 Tax=Panicum virgatum TaxID=38727 RepID=A0A8T0PBL0_PANVG|nr:hypothetical protein PVAP13_8NG185902 [Panicum virgatum]KAG2556648.1 hypothetical protein PVAP13_8NG185902 [Panicum virgatum]KAG2556653.1 hypothetical protein PVAP13_8NG185902 [Panicum virgatum]
MVALNQGILKFLLFLIPLFPLLTSDNRRRSMVARRPLLPLLNPPAFIMVSMGGCHDGPSTAPDSLRRRSGSHFSCPDGTILASPKSATSSGAALRLAGNASFPGSRDTPNWSAHGRSVVKLLW